MKWFLTPISHWEFVNNAEMWNKCLCWVLVSWWGVEQAWKQHFHMDRIKRSTVFQSQQLDFNMSGYTQPAWLEHRVPSSVSTMETLKDVLRISILSPPTKLKESLELPPQSARSHVVGVKNERKVFSPFGKKGVQPAHTSLDRTAHTGTTNCGSDKCVLCKRAAEKQRAGMLSTLLSAASVLDSIIKLH